MFKAALHLDAEQRRQRKPPATVGAGCWLQLGPNVPHYLTLLPPSATGLQQEADDGAEVGQH